jgi:alkylation response protein AidB-like acyl-CoA dehydrogenase
VDLDFSDDDVAFRAEVREWLTAHVPGKPLTSMDTAAGFEEHRIWERELYGGGWSAVSWPKEYGGREASPLQWLIFEEEYHAAGAPGRVAQNGIFLLAPTMFEHATPEQRARFLPPMASGEEIWAQAWSEPDAGSDLAAIKSVAVQVPGGWRLRGQKTWSSRGAFADWAFGPFRSDPQAQRHHGMSYFVFPLDAEGITVRAVTRLDDDPGFAEIFLDDVFVPDEYVIGEAGRGWNVAMSTAGSERGLTLRSPGRFLASAQRLLDLWGRHGDRADTALRNRVLDAWIGAQAYRLYTFETIAKMADGKPIEAESSLNKIFWSELDVRLHETALDILATRGELAPGAPEAEADGRWLDGYLFSLSGPIYAGTNEIQRNVVAERLLGLPRGSR